ncbi:ABC transporter ATP-binding protein [Salibacterium halotolerans]|uniref:ABC-type cobalamin/Fe3+-siderophores transport system, ATPase component n=1 Tax=Salibacterium halotolerans TaxID=1884432 RepID=A0A1I5NYC9_9BACI|nr:ABC transporter ATP-binding protein [Salibacterium halotolerans]SFP26231.1 ABC-type cobalamin/Fe3+-siderophores transport system, ATPase component [Salibacterium halotolerans]
MLEVKELQGGYNGVSILEHIEFHAEPGEVIGVIGPNGSGKSTLLKMLYREMKPLSGNIFLNKQPLHALTQKQIASQLAVLPQQEGYIFSYTVFDVVELGRYPYQKGWFGQRSSNDLAVIKEAMRQTNVEHLGQRTLDQLSGGEKQRVFLARAMAQEPQCLVLDEPTNHLDIAYQMHLFDTLKRWAVKRGMTVIAAIHDLNLAALYSDRLLLLNDGRQECLDTPGIVLAKERMEKVYGTSFSYVFHPSFPRPQFMLEPERFSKPHGSPLFTGIIKEEREGQPCLSSSIYWKTLSTSADAGGFGWSRTFPLFPEKERAGITHPSRRECFAGKSTNGHILMYAAITAEKTDNRRTDWIPAYGEVFLFIDTWLNEARMASVLADAAEAKGQVKGSLDNGGTPVFDGGITITICIPEDGPTAESLSDIRRAAAEVVYDRLSRAGGAKWQ